jgi:hypothetical protein
MPEDMACINLHILIRSINCDPLYMKASVDSTQALAHASNDVFARSAPFA